MLRERALSRQITAPTTRIGSTSRVSAVSARPTLPTCQKRKTRMTSMRGSRMALDSDVNAAVMMAPARASLSGVGPPRPSDPMR